MVSFKNLNAEITEDDIFAETMLNVAMNIKMVCSFKYQGKYAIKNRNW